MGFAALNPSYDCSPGLIPLALHALAQQLAVAAHRLGLLAGAPLGGLFVTAAELHFAEHPFALHFLFEDSESLVDIVFANEDLHGCVSPQLVEPQTAAGRGLSLCQHLALPGDPVKQAGAALPKRGAVTYWRHGSLEDRPHGASGAARPRRRGRRSDGALGAPARRGHDRDDGGCRRHRPRRATGAHALPY